MSTRAVFPDQAAAVAYLATLQDGFDWRLPPFDGPREYAGHVTRVRALPVTQYQPLPCLKPQAPHGEP